MNLESSFASKSSIPFCRDRERKTRGIENVSPLKIRIDRSIGSLNEESAVRERSGSRVRATCLRREISRFEDRLIIPSAGGGRGERKKKTRWNRLTGDILAKGLARRFVAYVTRSRRRQKRVTTPFHAFCRDY